MIALNYRRLGKAGPAVLSVAAGTAITAFVAYLALELKSAPFLSTILALFAIWVADSLQDDAVDKHRRQGGRIASGWLAAGVGLVVAAALICAALVSHTFVAD